MYYLLGICLALAALAAANALASMMTVGLWRIARAGMSRRSARARANAFFALRMLPLAGPAACVLAFLLPSYVAHEPRQSGESVGPGLAVLAAVSVLGLSLTLWRIVAVRRANHRLTREWLLRSEPVRVEGINIPAYSIEHAFPVVAIVGTRRPRLFVARQLFTQLTPDELSATLAHECGHLAARDNLKRLLMRACRDVLSILPGGRALERACVEESETAADEFVVREGGKVAALSLAEALLKIARLVPEDSKPALPAGAFLIEEAGDGLVRRVLRLLQLADGDSADVRPRARLAAYASRAFYFSLLASAVYLATYTDAMRAFHTAMEAFIYVLQ